MGFFFVLFQNKYSPKPNNNEMHNSRNSSSSDRYAKTIEEVYTRTRESSSRLEAVTGATKQELSDEEESASASELFFFTFLFPVKASDFFYNFCKHPTK